MMNFLTIDEINALSEKGIDNLTAEEKDLLHQSILNNPIAFEIAQRGAMLREDWTTLFYLSQQDNSNKWFEKGESSNQSVSND